MEKYSHENNDKAQIGQSEKYDKKTYEELLKEESKLKEELSKAKTSDDMMKIVMQLKDIENKKNKLVDLAHEAAIKENNEIDQKNAEKEIAKLSTQDQIATLSAQDKQKSGEKIEDIMAQINGKGTDNENSTGKKQNSTHEKQNSTTEQTDTQTIEQEKMKEIQEVKDYFDKLSAEIQKVPSGRLRYIAVQNLIKNCAHKLFPDGKGGTNYDTYYNAMKNPNDYKHSLLIQGVPENRAKAITDLISNMAQFRDKEYEMFNKVDLTKESTGNVQDNIKIREMQIKLNNLHTQEVKLSNEQDRITKELVNYTYGNCHELNKLFDGELDQFLYVNMHSTGIDFFKTLVEKLIKEKSVSMITKFKIKSEFDKFIKKYSEAVNQVNSIEKETEIVRDELFNIRNSLETSEKNTKNANQENYGKLVTLGLLDEDELAQ